MHHRLNLLEEVARSLGFRGTVLYIAQERALRLLRLLPGQSGKPHTYRLSTPLSQHSVVCRFGTSDREVFIQVFIRKSYGYAEHVKGIGTIVDCGANVGYASAYFLTLFPNARLVAVEPDPVTFATLERNLKPFGSRVTAIQAAVWSQEAGLRVVRGAFGDGEAWSTQVKECAEGEDPDVRGLDIGTLMTENGLDTIDILKVDIEDAETKVFSDAGPWIQKIGTIMIELHGPAAVAVFTDAITKAGRFVLTTDRELTIASPLVHHVESTRIRG